MVRIATGKHPILNDTDKHIRYWLLVNLKALLVSFLCRLVLSFNPCRDVPSGKGFKFHSIFH